MNQSLMSRLKGQKAMEKTMVVVLFLLLVALSEAGLPCETTADCRRSVCIQKSCKPKSVAGGPCEVDSHCVKTTDTCINNLCSSLSPPGGPCASSDKCMPPATCSANNICLSPTGGDCSANEHCASPSDSCIGKTCKAKGKTGETCDANDNADCVPGFKCVETSCAFDLSPLQWEGNKAMSTARSFAASVAVGDFLFVFGGRVSAPSGIVLTDSVEMYNPANNSWVTKASIPVSTWKHSVIAVGKSVFLVGGADSSDVAQTNFLRYDTEKDSWDPIDTYPPLPDVGVHSTAATVAGTTIFLFGGQTGNAVSTAVDKIYTFDTSAKTNQWNTPATLSTATSQASAVRVETSIYITGGTANSIQTLVYDITNLGVPPQDQSLPLATPRTYHTSFYIPSSQKIYLVSGLSNSADKAKTVETLNLLFIPASRSWRLETTAALGLTRFGSSGGLIGSRFYLPGSASLSTTSVPSSLLNVLDISGTPKWIPFASSPTPLYVMAVGKVGSSIITAGGYDQTSSPFTGTLKYDISSDSWTDLSVTIPQAVIPGSAVVGSELFAIGGTSSFGVLASTVSLNAAQTAWETRGTLKAPRQALCTAVEGTKIFAFGGATGGFSVLDTMEIFETDSNSPNFNKWRDVTDDSKTTGNSPTPLFYCAAVSTGSKILILGGVSSLFPYTATGLIQSFDIKTEKWDAPIPISTSSISPRGLHSATVLKGFVIVSGGTVDATNSLAKVEAFEISTGKVTSLPDMPSPRYGHGSVTDGDSVIVVGGISGLLIAPVEKFRVPVA